MTWMTYESPFGPLTLAGRANALSNVYFPGRAPSLAETDRDPVAFTDAATQLEQYFAGERRAFDITLDLVGTTFQLRVWRALQQIPYGETTTYGALARQLGIVAVKDTPAARIVASAIARTPAPIVVPCHRVLAADGSLTGYLGGLHRKQALLELEADGVAPTLLKDGQQRRLSQQRQLAML
jgi:methylated-DNA-[protein]-cysteine S-methyltransferase